MSTKANDWLVKEPGAADFARVFRAVRGDMAVALERQLASHPVFSISLLRLPEADRYRRRDESWARFDAAMNGDWSQYTRALERDGAGYAMMGISVEDWYEVATAWSRFVIPALVQDLSHDPARLTAALGAMQSFLDGVMSVLSRAYVEASEERRRRGEEDLAITLECIPDGVLVSDEAGQISRVNPAALRLLGLEQGSVVGRPLADVVKLSLDGHAQHDDACLLETVRGPLPVLAARSAIVRGQQRAGEVVVLKDDTSTRERQTHLARWGALFESVAWGMVITDDAGCIELVNDALARSYGTTRESFVGTMVQSLYAPGELERVRAERGDEARRTGRITVEAVHRRLDGSDFPVRLEAARIPGLRGEPGWVLTIHDISATRQMEMLRRRGDELEVENRRIEEASRMKSEFLANMSHELRTPLNAILGFSDLLVRFDVGALNPEQHEFVSDIHASGKHLLRLINDILDLSKIEAGKLELYPEEGSMRVIVDEVVGVMRGVSRERRVKIVEHLDPSADAIFLDVGRLKQVFYNYLSNAIKFTAEGSTVEIDVRREGPAALRLSVRDRGPGIAPADVALLFVEFEQLDSGRNKSHGGTGLGLALTKRIVEAQGGSVGVDSAPGEGSTFYAVLPLQAKGRNSLPLPRRIPGATPNAPRILVVEDNIDDQERMLGTLVAAGFAVDTAVTGAQALEAIQARTYDAVTLDILLPDTSGLAVLAALHRELGDKRIPVIVVSVVTEHVTGGYVVHDVLEKPLESRSLLSSLARAGVIAPPSAPILVVDDDERSARLAVATLATAGLRGVIAANGAEALLRAAEERPAAVVLDLVMPELDGFGFLERFRAVPEFAGVPVLVWTVKDLSREELAELAHRAERVLPKDGSGAWTLVEQLRQHLAHGSSTRRDSTSIDRSEGAT